MTDHDQRLKLVLKEFFAEFFQAFPPEWAERFDFATVQWLDTEVFSDPPRDQRRQLDLVARVSTRAAVAASRPGEPEDWITLVHVEIESGDSAAPLRPRMYAYYEHLRRTHTLPVLPIGLFLRVGLEGIGHDVYEERFWDLPVLRFEYLYVVLPALDAEASVAGGNVLAAALAAFMRMPARRKVWLRAEALRRIMECPENAWRKFLLGELVQTYIPLGPGEREEFREIMDTDTYKGVREFGTTWYGDGQLAGRRELLVAQLEARFGPLSETVRRQLEESDLDRLMELALKFAKATALKDMGLEE